MGKIFKFSVFILELLMALFVLALLCLFYGFYIEPQRLLTRSITISSENWTGPPLKIALISDIHIGGEHVPAKRVINIVDRTNELGADIILLGGDYIQGHEPREEQTDSFNQDIKTGLSSLAMLQAPLGVYAVIGNHDVWYGADYVAQQLRLNGLKVLRNEAVNLPDGLCLVGFRDHHLEDEDAAAYSDCKENKNVIALMHSPDSFDYLRSDTALAVAGHTHGGQINIPLIGRRITATGAGPKYAYGKVDVNGIPAFVTAGIGTSILPARFRAPPEIVMIELTP